jgi:DNA replication licensing factor MCM7
MLILPCQSMCKNIQVPQYYYYYLTLVFSCSLFVHKYKRKPDSERQSLEPSSIKQYIAAARSLEPTIPKELSTYVIEAYVSLRAQDGSGPAATKQRNNDQATMTARQLLSILRLSQALARLRLAVEISKDDVDEAIRLTHASKASLYDDAPVRPAEDSISAIFTSLRDLSTSTNSNDLSYATILAIVLRKGFTEQQLIECVDEYENLGVLSLNVDRTSIIML